MRKRFLAGIADQPCYWTQSWQQGERKVDEHVESGQVKVSMDIDELLADLDKVRAKAARRRSDRRHQP